MWKLLQVFGRALACVGKRWIIYCFDSFKLKAILTNSGPFMTLVYFSFDKKVPNKLMMSVVNGELEIMLDFIFDHGLLL